MRKTENKHHFVYDLKAICPVCGRAFWLDSDPVLKSLEYQILYYQVLLQQHKPVKRCPGCHVGLSNFYLEGRTVKDGA